MFKKNTNPPSIWEDVHLGWQFQDGSSATQVHDTHTCECYSIWLQGKQLVVSEDHIFLCYVGKLDPQYKSQLDALPKKIPTACNTHFLRDEEGLFYEVSEAVEFDNIKFAEDLYWLSAADVHFLICNKQKVFLVNNLRWKNSGALKYNKVPVKSIDYVGKRDCFCISTDTKRYEVCGVVHHNSVTLRNIIFHSLTHSDDIKLGMVDLKVNEFARFKGMNNIVGVANTTREACELLRLCREVMMKRNKENAERGLTDTADYIPTKPTNKISLFGREFDENTEFQVEIRGEQKTMTAGEILEWVSTN